MKYLFILLALTTISCKKTFSCDCVYPDGKVYKQPYETTKRSAKKGCDLRREQFKSVNAVCHLVEL